MTAYFVHSVHFCTFKSNINAWTSTVYSSLIRIYIESGKYINSTSSCAKYKHAEMAARIQWIKITNCARKFLSFHSSFTISSFIRNSRTSSNITTLQNFSVFLYRKSPKFSSSYLITPLLQTRPNTLILRQILSRSKISRCSIFIVQCIVTYLGGMVSAYIVIST